MLLRKAGRESPANRIALELQKYNLGRREIGHIHGDSLVHIPFPKKVRNELVAAGRAEPHHILPESEWVSIFLRQASDVERAIELLQLSFEIANQGLRNSARIRAVVLCSTSLLLIRRRLDQWCRFFGVVF